MAAKTISQSRRFEVMNSLGRLSRVVAVRSVKSNNKREVVRMVSFVADVGGWRPVDEQYDYHQEIARAAFADMLHDDERNRLYKSALHKAILAVRNSGRPVRVLDIGTGTGLLSIMAAQIGADSIVACEAFKPMADCASKIIEKNGFKDKIQLIPKRSTEITVGKNGDMEHRANVLVTEVFDTELIGEGAIETFRHAHAELLEKDCFVVPDSATVYAQAIECPTLQRWNKLKDVKDENHQTILKTPLQIKNCPGSAAVHDIQLSQLSRSLFREITKPVAVFQFDWSGKKSVEKNETLKFSEKCLKSGTVQMVFMWWDLKMDYDGKTLLSCAPWWHHPNADFNSLNPERSIPWRDHWMQAVYYFPEPQSVRSGDAITLYSSHDEFSLWFEVDVRNDFENRVEYKNPVCECGVHMIYSRTHVSYMNDADNNNKFIRTLRKIVDGETVCLCLNGASLVGLLSAKIGAKKVIYVEPGVIGKRILESYVKTNDLTNSVTIVSDIKSALQYKNDINLVINDPHFTNAILPWDNFQFGYSMKTLEPFLNPQTRIVPCRCSVWMVSVEFLDLHKIKKPLGICEDIDLTIFDDLIKSSRNESDDEIEPQPLWEYPCVCRSNPIKIGNVVFTDSLKDPISLSGSVKCDNDGTVNGIVFWLEWKLLNDGDGDFIGSGPLKAPMKNHIIEWDPSVRQGVKIFEKNVVQQKDDVLCYNFFYNPNCGSAGVHAHYEKEQTVN